MKHMETLKQEPYEAPAILEIAPVTMVRGDGTSDEYTEPEEM